MPLHPGGGGGGGGYFHMYAYWVCAARETPIFSPEFPFRSISFSQITPKNLFRSITILNFLADFAIPETIIFKISLISSPLTAGSARTQSIRQHRGLAASQTRPGSSGDSHFHAQNGSSSFRSPAFSRSTRSSFRSPCPFFTLPRHIPTKIWGEYTPPPPLGPYMLSVSWVKCQNKPCKKLHFKKVKIDKWLDFLVY